MWWTDITSLFKHDHVITDKVMARENRATVHLCVPVRRHGPSCPKFLSPPRNRPKSSKFASFTPLRFLPRAFWVPWRRSLPETMADSTSMGSPIPGGPPPRLLQHTRRPDTSLLHPCFPLPVGAGMTGLLIAQANELTIGPAMRRSGDGSTAGSGCVAGSVAGADKAPCPELSSTRPPHVRPMSPARRTLALEGEDIFMESMVGLFGGVARSECAPRLPGRVVSATEGSVVRLPIRRRKGTEEVGRARRRSGEEARREIGSRMEWGAAPPE